MKTKNPYPSKDSRAKSDAVGFSLTSNDQTIAVNNLQDPITVRVPNPNRGNNSTNTTLEMVCRPDREPCCIPVNITGRYYSIFTNVTGQLLNNSQLIYFF